MWESGDLDWWGSSKARWRIAGLENSPEMHGPGGREKWLEVGTERARRGCFGKVSRELKIQA